MHLSHIVPLNPLIYLDVRPVASQSSFFVELSTKLNWNANSGLEKLVSHIQKVMMKMMKKRLMKSFLMEWKR